MSFIICSYRLFICHITLVDCCFPYDTIPLPMCELDFPHAHSLTLHVYSPFRSHPIDSFRFMKDYRGYFSIASSVSTGFLLVVILTCHEITQGDHIHSRNLCNSIGSNMVLSWCPYAPDTISSRAVCNFSCIKEYRE